MQIYRIINLKNGKVYIGQTTVGLEKRFENHVRASSRRGKKTKFHKALNKYGKDNFLIEEIDTAETLEELNQKETKWIQFYKAYELGYNTLRYVNENPMKNPEVVKKHLNSMRDPEVRERISKTMIEYRRKNGVSEETRKKLGDKSRKAHKEGRMPKSVITEETIRKATEAKKKKTTLIYKGSTYEFDSLKESCLWLTENGHIDRHPRHLARCAKKSNETGEPYLGARWIY